MEKLIVRDARPDERPAIRELTLRSFAEYAHSMEPQAWLGLESALKAALAWEGPVERIVAERAGELVGSVLLFPPERDTYGIGDSSAAAPEVRLLAVDPEARGFGVGRALMRECVRKQEFGATAIGLHTSKTMAVALAMYERMGFVRARNMTSSRRERSNSLASASL